MHLTPSLVATVLCTGLITAADYARPDLLLEPAELAKPENLKRFRILDARTQDKYQEGHIPGAFWVDHDGWGEEFYAGQDPATWSKNIGSLGISSLNRPVVIYDDTSAKSAARIWWILRYWGLKDVRLLNGGWRGWQTIDGTIEKTSPPATTNTLVLHPDRTLLANKNDVLKELKQGKDQIVDARSFKEFCGTTKLARRGGAMPDAKHLEWSAVIERKTQRFKSADELKKLFRTAGIDLNQPTVTHCQSGGRSSVMAFTLELMGAKDVRNYYRGWSEWGNAKDTPIVQPNKK